MNLRNPETNLSRLLTRCDQDLGGFSTCHLDEVHEGQSVFARFHGDLSLDLPDDRPDVVRLGYSMFRTKDIKPAFWGSLGNDFEFMDWSFFNQVALRVRGDRRKYFVNIQADTPYPTDLYQHRLFLKNPGNWETVTVPFYNFILTNGGVIQQQEKLDTSAVRSIGIGLIDGQYGPYRLDIDWIKVIAGDPITPKKPEIEGQTGKPPGKRLSVDD